MAIERLPVHPPLRVIDGGSPAMRREEAQIERIAGLDEAIEGATFVHELVAGLASDLDDGSRPTDLRWSLALNGIGRIAHRAERAKAEYLALLRADGGNDAA